MNLSFCIVSVILPSNILFQCSLYNSHKQKCSELHRSFNIFQQFYVKITINTNIFPFILASISCPRTVNKLTKLNSCYFWISKAILFTLTYYIVTVWIDVKCILLKSEHLNVPLFIDLAVEFNLLKSTHENSTTGEFPPFIFSPSQCCYILIYKGNLGCGGKNFFFL